MQYYCIGNPFTDSYRVTHETNRKYLVRRKEVYHCHNTEKPMGQKNPCDFTYGKSIQQEPQETVEIKEQTRESGKVKMYLPASSNSISISKSATSYCSESYHSLSLYKCGHFYLL